MSTARTPTNEGPRLYRSRSFMPAFCLFLAVLMFGAFAIGGDAATGLRSAAVMVLLGAVFLFGSRRSETLAGLGGPGRDERWHAIDVTATAMTGARPRRDRDRLLAVRGRAGPRRHAVRGARRGRRRRLRARRRAPALAFVAPRP